MSTRQQQTIRFALLFSTIAAAVAFGAWLPGHLLSRENGRGEVAVPSNAKERDQQVSEELRRLQRARYELALAQLLSNGFVQVAEVENPMRRQMGGGSYSDRHALELFRCCLGAILDYTDAPRLRYELLAPILQKAQKMEAFVEDQRKNLRNPNWSQDDLHGIKLVRMEIQVESLKAKKAETTGRF